MRTIAGDVTNRAQSASSFVSATNFVVGYGGEPIVNGATVVVDRGEIVSLVGPNGAGKSTLVKGIVGLVRPSSGNLLVCGRDVSLGTRAAQIAKLGLAYVPQTQFVFPRLTVLENLEMGAYLLRRSERLKRADELLERFPILRPLVRRNAGTLSGGEQRILGIARALGLRSEAIILDEPTAALSPQACDLIWETVVQLKSENLAIIVIEQRTQSVLGLTDRGYVMVTGKCVLVASGHELLHDYNLGDIFLGQVPIRISNGSS